MQLLSGCLTVFLVVYSVKTTHGTSLMVRMNETAIECASNADITFKLYSAIPNISATIAECDSVMKCIMLQKNTGNKYNVSYTGRGGILRILRLDEETTGTYQCYETHDPRNFVTQIITLSPIAIEADSPIKSSAPASSEVISPIVMGTLKDKSFECTSNADITFKIINNKSKTSVTIAECDLTIKSCNILKPSFKEKYNLLFTGQGGVLQIISFDNETIGTYRCYETHNPNNFVSIEIILNSTKEANNTYGVNSETSSTTANELDENGVNHSNNVLTIVLPISALVLIGVVIVGIFMMKKDCSSCKRPKEVERNATANAALLGRSNLNRENKRTDELHMDSMRRRRSNAALVVVTIDFGTTYSGYAYMYNNNPTKVHYNDNWINTGSSTLRLKARKTPTIILLDDKGQFHSFGFDVKTHFEAVEHEHRGWRLFRNFKIVLHSNKNLSDETTVDDIEGNSYPAMKLFTMAIRYLRERFLTQLQRESPELHETEIQYIITVPAAWDVEAKQFMRKAAENAGITNERLELAFESEMAAIRCSKLQIVQVGSKYFVVSIGGGVADITAFQVLSNSNVVVLHEASGGPWGGANIDQQFTYYLTNELGDEVIKKLRREHIEDYLEILNSFETKKCSQSNFTNAFLLVWLPYYISSNCKFSIKTSQIKAWFENPISCLITRIKSLLCCDTIKDVSTIFLVGGFAESFYVEQRIREEFAGIRVIVPQKAGLVVLEGAVLFGHNPDIITSRPI